jgi:signal transduction histidine kinase
MTAAPAFLKLRAMRTDRLTVYANAAWLAALGIAFALRPSPLPVSGIGKPWEAVATFRVLGMSIGTALLGLLFLWRLAAVRDRRRLALALFAANAVLGAAGLIARGSLLGSRTALWAALFHLLLAAGALALARRPDGPRGPLLLQALLVGQGLLVLGIGMGTNPAWPGVTLAVAMARPEPMTWLLGIETAALGLALAVLGNPATTDDRRRLLLGLALGNAAAVIMAFIQQTQIWGEVPWRWCLAAAPWLLAAASCWAGLRPEAVDAGRPGSPSPWRLPRRDWLRQVSEAAAQEERNRLARDLHDSIKQQIFGIHLGAATAQARWDTDPAGARAAVDDIRRCAQEAMVEMNALLQQLRPQALATLGLVEALREQCEALGYRSGARVSLEIGEPVPDGRLPPGAQETLFRIAQEALANVARHARAQTARVHLGRQGDKALLRVEDDGQGFDPGTESSGMGLRNLKERANSLRGRLEVDSAPGGGTRVSVAVPLLPAPATERDRIAREIRRERWLPLRGAMAVFLFLAGPVLGPKAQAVFQSAAMTLLAMQALESAGKIHEAVRDTPGAAPGAVSRLRHLGRRNRAFLFLAEAWAASELCRQTAGGWNVLWGLACVSCLALAAGQALLSFRGGLPQVRLGRFAWPAGWERYGVHTLFLVGLALLLFSPVFLLTLGAMLDPSRLVRPFFLASAALMTAWFLGFQPRAEGAPS